MTNRLVIVFIFLGILVACEPVGKTLAQKEEQERIPTQESWNPKILINSDERETVQAQADYSAQYENPREVVFYGHVRLDFFDEDGAHSSLMTADTGRIDDQTHLFVARGNVVVTSDSGMTLSSSRLTWNEQEKSIYTDQPIVLTTRTDTLYGVGFESDARLENWVITRPTGVSYRELHDQ